MSNDFHQDEVRRAWVELRALGVHSLLSKAHGNPKISKGIKINIFSKPLHLAPYNLSGFHVCPNASKGCIAACLHTAGNPQYMANKNTARIARTRAFFKARSAFMVALAGDIAATILEAEKLGMVPGIRLNATSDVPFEIIPVTLGGIKYPNIMAVFPDLQFYDYTKRANRKKIPTNYHLTFSLSEENIFNAANMLDSGMNVAVVMNVRRSEKLPNYGAFVYDHTYRTYSFKTSNKAFKGSHLIVDGDTHDFRPLDGKGKIVGLRAKGLAKIDTSGFVQIVA